MVYKSNWNNLQPLQSLDLFKVKIVYIYSPLFDSVCLSLLIKKKYNA